MENNISVISINKTRVLVLTALLFAISIILAIIENSLPPLPITVPGVKLGLSNIIVMYALFFMGKRQAFSIAVLKSLFVVIIRGLIAGFLSLFGGIISLIAMCLLIAIFKEKISYLVISIFGAVAHNVGQFLAISIIFTNLYLLAYLPVLLIAGVIAGISTATMLRLIMPAFKKLA